jgi:hypothetical protein
MWPPESSDFGVFQSIVGDWYESLKDPVVSQKHTLTALAADYSKTQYGKNHGASQVSEIADFRARFPVIDYRGLNPYFSEVRDGNFSAILPEPLACWVMTRGSTGTAKVLPVTETHLRQIFTCGARALVNYALRKDDFDVLSGKILNLNFPSSVHTIEIDGKQMTYGYSSGTYARLNPVFDQVSLVPRQESIDALGSGITKSFWEKRFELAYQEALNENVTATIGVSPVILAFSRYVKRKHGKMPKEFWKFRALFCTSVPKIQFRYAPVLRRYFGDVPVVEIYSATEGVFAQQLDDLPYVTPNYDKYFFEVQTGKEVKLLCELERGEWGKLIISSCLFPRYDIGDMIEGAGQNYFRVFGRSKLLTILEHRLYRLLFKWFL